MRKILTIVIVLIAGICYAQLPSDENELYPTSVLVSLNPRIAKWGFENVYGKLVLPAKWDDASSFQWGYAAVKLGYRWGAINTVGKLVVPLQYKEPMNFKKSGYAIVTKELDDEAYGVVNNKGQEVLPCRYDAISIEEWEGGIFFIAKPNYRNTPRNKKYGNYSGYMIYDHNGTDILPDSVWFHYHNYILENPNKKTTYRVFVIVSPSGKGLLDEYGKIVLEPVYDKIEEYDHALLIHKQGKKGLFANSSLILDAKYDEIKLNTIGFFAKGKDKTVYVSKDFTKRELGTFKDTYFRSRLFSTESNSKISLYKYIGDKQSSDIQCVGVYDTIVKINSFMFAFTKLRGIKEYVPSDKGRYDYYEGEFKILFEGADCNNYEIEETNLIKASITHLHGSGLYYFYNGSKYAIFNFKSRNHKTSLSEYLHNLQSYFLYEEQPYFYEDITNLNKGQITFVVKRDGKYMLVDSNGDKVKDMTFETKPRFLQRHAYGETNIYYSISAINGKYGLSDFNTEKIIIPYLFDDVIYYFDNLCAVKKNGKYVLLNPNALSSKDFEQYVQESKYLYDEMIGMLDREGFYVMKVRTGVKWGLISLNFQKSDKNKYGLGIKELTKCKYDYIGNFGEKWENIAIGHLNGNPVEFMYDLDTHKIKVWKK